MAEGVGFGYDDHGFDDDNEDVAKQRLSFQKAHPLLQILSDNKKCQWAQ